MNAVSVEEYVVNKIIDSGQKKTRIAEQRIHDRHSDESRIGKNGCRNKDSSLGICDLGFEHYDPENDKSQQIIKG